MQLHEILQEIADTKVRIMMATPGTIEHNGMVIALIVLQDTYINKINSLMKVEDLVA